MGKDRVQIVCEARKNCPDLADACVARAAVQKAHGISIGKARSLSQRRELIKTSSGESRAAGPAADALERDQFTVLYTSEVNEQRNACEKALTSEERSRLRANSMPRAMRRLQLPNHRLKGREGRVDGVKRTIDDAGPGPVWKVNR